MLVLQAGWFCDTEMFGVMLVTQPRAVAAVVAHPVDVDLVAPRRRLDLEIDRAADVDAERIGEALDGRALAAADVPDRLGRARQLVLAHDRVGA